MLRLPGIQCLRGTRAFAIPVESERTLSVFIAVSSSREPVTSASSPGKLSLENALVAMECIGAGAILKAI
jgi:hypothetical protein